MSERAEGTCRFCGLRVVDGRKESGYTGEGPDWMTPDGDFGCDQSPETSWDPDDEDGGCGSHAVTEAEAVRAETSGEAARLYERREAGRLAAERIRRAAPALLSALEAMVQWVDEGCDLHSKVVNVARSAIADARGSR